MSTPVSTPPTSATVSQPATPPTSSSAGRERLRLRQALCTDMASRMQLHRLAMDPSPHVRRVALQTAANLRGPKREHLLDMQLQLRGDSVAQLAAMRRLVRLNTPTAWLRLHAWAATTSDACKRHLVAAWPQSWPKEATLCLLTLSQNADPVVGLPLADLCSRIVPLTVRNATLSNLAASNDRLVLQRVIEVCLDSDTPESVGLAYATIEKLPGLHNNQGLMHHLVTCLSQGSITVLLELCRKDPKLLEAISPADIEACRRPRIYPLWQLLVEQGNAAQRRAVCNSMDGAREFCEITNQTSAKEPLRTILLALLEDRDASIASDALRVLLLDPIAPVATAIAARLRGQLGAAPLWANREKITFDTSQLAKVAAAELPNAGCALLLQALLKNVGELSVSDILLGVAPPVDRDALFLSLADSTNPHAHEMLMETYQSAPDTYRASLIKTCLSTSDWAASESIAAMVWPPDEPLSPALVTRIADLLAKHVGVRQHFVEAFEKLSVAAQESVLDEVPLRQLRGMEHTLLVHLRAHQPAVFAQLADGAYDRDNPQHRVAAYLLLLEQKHLGKFLLDEPEFTMKHWRDIGGNLDKPSKTGYLHNTDQAEAIYLGYETHVFAQRALLPAIHAATRLNLPLVVIGNLSCGGTAMSALSKGDLAKCNVRYIAAKQGSGPAHGRPNIFNPNLLSPEDATFIARHTPIIVVVDNSTSQHHADGMWGYRNYFRLLEHSRGMPDKKSRFWQGPSSAELLQDSNGPQTLACLKDAVDSAASTSSKPYVFHATTLTGEVLNLFNKNPPAFSWDTLRGPAVVCVHSGLTHEQIKQDDTPQSRATLHKAHGGHRVGYWDDKAGQSPVWYMGKKGYPKLAPPLHIPARAHYKELQAMPTTAAIQPATPVEVLTVDCTALQGTVLDAPKRRGKLRRAAHRVAGWLGMRE